MVKGLVVEGYAQEIPQHDFEDWEKEACGYCGRSLEKGGHVYICKQRQIIFCSEKCEILGGQSCSFGFKSRLHIHHAARLK